MSDEITAIVEGWNSLVGGDGSSKITYIPTDIFIPENASLLRAGFDRMQLYARYVLSSNNSLQFSLERVQFAGKGWEVCPPCDFRGWFQMHRAILTRNGRIYLSEIYRGKPFEFYTSLLPEIIRDCSDFFLGLKRIESLGDRRIH
jgi:hypothetical protein